MNEVANFPVAGSGAGMQLAPAGGALMVASSRAAQEVQAMIVSAKKFPRDEVTAFTKIINACKRKGLAEVAMYEYKRGGSLVTGPSIRLAEELKRNWGNIDTGWMELERKPGTGNQAATASESLILAYAWDTENNTRATRTFTVKHWRDTKSGGYALTEERDIYELNANQAARRLRACILELIPGDITEAAVSQCDKSIEGGDGPIIDRVRIMVIAFAELGVTQAQIEKRLGHKLEATTERELVSLKKVFAAIRDDYGKKEQFFDVAGTDTAQASALNERVGAAGTPAATPAPVAAPAAAAPKAPVVAPPAAAQPPAAPAKAPKPAAKPKPPTVAAVPPPPPVPAPAPVIPPAEELAPEYPAETQAEAEDFENFSETAIEQQTALPKPYDTFVFVFGKFTGKKVSDIPFETLPAYLVNLKKAPREKQYLDAEAAVEAYLADASASAGL